MGKLFGTDGIRGIANDDLTVNLAFKVGLASSEILAGETVSRKTKILIGKDTRISGDMLESAIAAGLCASGSNVVLGGVMPTPAVAYLVRECGFDAGIMISASHNTSEYNGIKIFNKYGFKLSDEREERIEYKIENYHDIKLMTHGSIGTISEDSGLISKYINHVSNISKHKEQSGLKVLIDCANGSASVTAGKIFKFENLEKCDIINASPDGVNINDNCGSTHLKNLTDKIISEGYDIGIAFDGDADRCLAVDETGNIIDGDMILCAVADEMREQGILKNDTMVVTKLSNLGLHKFCQEQKYNVEQTDVGDRFVLERMLQKNFNLGGEQSGHIIVTDYATTGDGQITATLMMDILRKSKNKASQVFGKMKRYPQVELNIKVPAEKADRKKAVLSDLDVVRTEKNIACKLGGNGRIILRPSGTEPLIRVMIEGEDYDTILGYAKEIEGVIVGNL